VTTRPIDPTTPSPSAGPPGRPVHRRSVLRGLGLGAATVVVAGTGAVSYRVFDNGVLDAGSGTAFDPWTHWRDDPSPQGAVSGAILAANPHNTQPWVFDVAPDRIDLFADPTRRVATLDPLDREQHVGLGCALENLVLALGARGFATRVELLPEPSDSSHVATVTWSPGPRTESPLHEAIGARQSNRGPYTTESVPSGVLESLSAEAAGLDGVQLVWITAPEDLTEMSRLIVSATEAIVADTEQSVDSFAWFRSSRDEIDAHRDGLTLDGQGMSPLLLTAAKLLPASSRTAGDAFWLEQVRTVHTATAAAYGVVAVADPDDPATRLTGGRLLQRVHLAATNLGLGLQHMNEVTERIDRDATTGAAATFGPALDALLATPGRHVLSTVRIGHPERAGRLSPRRDPSAVLR
jgi:hypothetical protein